MTRFTESDDLKGAEFVDTNLRGARFVGADLSDVVMRGVEVLRVEVDSPWLFDGDTFFRVNGVDVLPYVEAELNRRFPGRALQQAGDPEELLQAWDALQRVWTATLERAASMPDGTVDASVAGEWSFSQTLRHLVHATDIWLGKAVLEREQPFHPVGLGYGDDGSAAPTPPYAEVLEAHADRVGMVRDFIANTTPEQLAEPRKNPHNPDHAETVLKCLHVILEEGWEHHRYAVRDLDALSEA